MKISILIPIYKVEKYIRRCAESIFRQTYLDLEIIFVDDASPDNSLSILKDTILSFPSRSNQITIISNDSNKGCIICLANDGTAYFVHADGYKAHEKDVQSISASTNIIAFAYKDGTVYWKVFDQNRFDQNDYSDIQEWSDVVQFTCGEGFIAGLKSDGSVVVSGGYLPSVLEGSKILLYDDDWPENRQLCNR